MSFHTILFVLRQEVRRIQLSLGWAKGQLQMLGSPNRSVFASFNLHLQRNNTKKKNCLDFKLRRSTACLSIHGDTSVLTCFQHLPFSTAPIPLFAQNLLPYHFKLAYKEPQQNSWNVKHFFFFWRGGRRAAS